MTTLGNLRSDRKFYRSVPKVVGAERCWYIDYYDGVSTGIVILDGKTLFAERIGALFSRRAKFLLVELSAQEVLFELQRHQLFQACVGSHTDYFLVGGEWIRDYNNVWPAAYHVRFYTSPIAKQIRNYSNNQVVGWMSGWTRDR